MNAEAWAGVTEQLAEVELVAEARQKPRAVPVRAHARFVGTTPFTDYRQMIEATRPEFVIALGRHCDMPQTFRFLVEAGIPFLGAVPFDPALAAASDLGEPLVVSAPTCEG